MKGWILSKHPERELTADKYELNRFLDVAAARGITMSIVTPEQFDLIVTRDDRRSILLDGEVTPLPDFLLPRMGAGTTYFALAVIRHLERLGVQVINSSTSIEAVKDKLYTQQILAECNLPVPKTMLVKFPVEVDRVARYLGFPVVVKTLSGSKGSGVYLCENETNLEDLMDLIEATKGNANIILQEFIALSHGRDLRVIVVGGEPVACMERSSANGGFKANFSRGGLVRDYPLTPEINALAVETARLLDLDIAGVDLLFDGDSFRICEANSSPGFKGMEQATGLNIPGLIYDYVDQRLGRTAPLPAMAVLNGV
jgi:gamma-F420-2:alpha-L-glutamate ligase